MDHKLIPAARSLLGWSQDDLAAKLGISQSALFKIEAGKSRPLVGTITKIRQAFEDAGVVITRNGVYYDDRPVVFFEGEDCYLRLLDDIFYTLKNEENAEVLFSGSDESLSPPAVVDRLNNIRRVAKMRSLIVEGDSYIMGRLSDYRQVPRKYFHNYVIATYSNKVGYVAETPELNRVLLLTNLHAAEAQHTSFEFFWDHGEKPKKSTAKERYTDVSS